MPHSASAASDIRAPRRKRAVVNHDVISMSSGLLLLMDLACLVLATVLSASVHEHWLAPLATLPRSVHPLGPAAVVMGVLAPVMLYDPRFGIHAHRGLIAPLVRSHTLRLTLFAGAVLGLGTLGGVIDSFTGEWLVLWFCIALLTTLLVRLSGGRYLRHLQSRGRLNEVVAIVGAGQVAGRLARTLRQSRPDMIDVLGIFDDESPAEGSGSALATGTIDQLLELGKTSRVDWILLALPVAAEHRIPVLLQRLKALSVPIGLCPAHVALDLPCHSVDYVGNGVPVSLLSGRPPTRWDSIAEGAGEYLPRWMITLALLPLQAIESLAARHQGPHA